MNLSKNILIQNIIIVGGGSSGWLTAAYLSNNFPNLNITIVDKEIGTPVGVGEATLLNFKRFMELCGFPESEWYDEIEATDKLGIAFPNWIEKDHHVYHPFFVSKTNSKEYKERLKIKLPNSFNAAYHINCGLLTTFIQNKIKDRVKFIASEVTSFDNNKLILKNGKTISGDLFIDCTGFKSILKKNRDRVELRNRLICDTAVASHVPYLNENTEKLPYVKCEAVNEGWVWTIPVQSRMGSGFLFNRNITNIENAKKFLSNYWSGRISPDDLKVIDWTPYYDKNIWDNNVVSVGLSAGFIEPLESTSLALCMEGVFQLSKRIYKNFYNPDDIEVYNKTMKIFFENSIDFVNMHYLVSKRKGVFWEQGRQLQKSEKHLMFEKKFDMDENLNFNDTDFFSSDNWYCWLTQSTQ
jgi:tryptophan 7-halogenase